MKRIYYYIFCVLSLGLVSACVVEESIDSAEGQLVHKVFDATFEESDMTTKTMLDGNVDEEGIRGLLWDPEDEIGVAQYNQSYQFFCNTVGYASSNGVFEGSIGQSSVYYAVYPYQSGMKHGTNINVTVPTVQTYRENSFDRNMAPMVGKGNDGEPLHFMNICGVLAIQLTGTEKVKSIIFETRNGEKVSGVCSVDTDYVEYPLLDTSTATETYVTLDCGEGVQLSGEAVPFHIVLPPGVYEGFTLYITTADGKFMKKTTSKALTIKRSIVTKAASFAFEENMTDVTDLSEHGHSNCYVVPAAGLYSFDADIIGNGEFGLIEGAGFHTSDPNISPVSVELLWEDRAGLIKSYALDQIEGKVRFMATSNEGNALIAVKDADGTILWSWHIWMTDQPADQNYENDVLGSFMMLDRNIGAIRADRGTGDEWKESIGLHYQWGRKDPFAQDKFTINSSQMSAGEALKYPATFINSSYWTSENTVAYWNPEKKTVYDPCPVGYRVPAEDVWYGFTDNGDSQYVNENHVSSTTWDNGWLFYRNSNSETAWYPATGYYSGSTGKSSTSYGYLWSANKSGSSGYYMYFRNDGYTYQNYATYPYYAYNVRCMKDGPVITVTKIASINSTSATVNGYIDFYGFEDVTIKGFVWGTYPDLTINNANVVEIDGMTGHISAEITNLTESTLYYIRAFAVVNEKVIYSQSESFITTNDRGIIDLSCNGTANCYLVSQNHKFYSFNLVKGNSNTKISGVVTAAVLWETANTDQEIPRGYIIKDVELLNDIVEFTINDQAEGNAVIAVYDNDNNILWSYHIWLTDSPDSQIYYCYDSETGMFTDEVSCVMMDRNIGALSATPQDVKSLGLLYQWGRKDPFVTWGSLSPSAQAYTTTEWPGVVGANTISDQIAFSISNPMTYIEPPYSNSTWFDSSKIAEDYLTFWGQSPEAKGLYDPCPVGWKVPGYADNSDVDVWTKSGFFSGYRVTDVNGYVFKNKGANIWYPSAGFRHRDGDLWSLNYMYSWTSISTDSQNAKVLSSDISSTSSSNMAYACSVRCMKDE